MTISRSSSDDIWAKLPEMRHETDAHLKAVSAMLDTGGWKVFEAQLGRVIEWLQGVAIDNPNPDARTQAIGAVKQLRIMKTWPADHAKACQDALSDPDVTFLGDDDISAGR